MSGGEACQTFFLSQLSLRQGVACSPTSRSVAPFAFDDQTHWGWGCHCNIRLVILCVDGHTWEERTHREQENENKIDK